MEKARRFLANLHKKKMKQQGQEPIFQDSKQAAETLCCTLDLLSLLKDTSPLDPSSPDWRILKALLELLVRLGICPHLSPGVGIPRDQPLPPSSSAFAAASAISTHLSSVSLSNPALLQACGFALSTPSILFVCAEALASFVWQTAVSNESSPSINAMCFDERETTGMETAHISMHDISASMSTMEQSPDVCTNGSPVSPISQLVMKFFLWDLMAAYLQLGFCPQESDSDATSCMNIARGRLNQMIEQFPVEQMVLTSFVLLNCNSPTPPSWMKAEVGKQLSKLVMRTGGLVAVLEELVSRVIKGNVESYDKVASHLAKVPKLVSTADEYFKAICPQLRPLLLFNHKPRDTALGETSLTAQNNIYHTAVSLACKLFSVEPVLAKKYLLQPIMKPLLALNSSQNMAGILSVTHVKDNELMHREEQVTENELVDSFVQLGVLLTAGSKGCLLAKEAILLEARSIVPLILKLHFQLAANDDLKPRIMSGSSKSHADSDKKTASKGITRGFLRTGLGNDEDPCQNLSILLRFKSSLADFVMAEINQPVEAGLPYILPFLMEHESYMARWPQEGEISEALQSTAHISSSPAMYLSRLLHVVENWPLVLALMGELLDRILNTRRVLIKSNASEISTAAELLKYMKDFEDLNTVVGTKALECDTCGAASLVKAILDDELVLSDEDMFELVLHMVNSVLRGIRALGRECTQANGGYNRSVLTDLMLSLNRIQSKRVSEKLRQMGFTLIEEIRTLRNAS